MLVGVPRLTLLDFQAARSQRNRMELLVYRGWLCDPLSLWWFILMHFMHFSVLQWVCITFVIVKDELLIQSIKVVSERVQRNADLFWKIGCNRPSWNIGLCWHRGVLCGLPPRCPLSSAQQTVPLLCSPTPGNAHSGIGPPWLNLGFASSSPCFEARLTLLLVGSRKHTTCGRTVGIFQEAAGNHPC